MHIKMSGELNLNFYFYFLFLKVTKFQLLAEHAKGVADESKDIEKDLKSNIGVLRKTSIFKINKKTKSQ